MNLLIVKLDFLAIVYSSCCHSAPQLSLSIPCLHSSRNSEQRHCLVFHDCLCGGVISQAWLLCSSTAAASRSLDCWVCVAFSRCWTVKREQLWGMREPDLFVVSVSTYILFSLYHVFLLSGRVCVCVWMPVCFIKMVHLTATHLTKQHTLGISRCWREVAIPELVNVVIVVVVMARETAMHSYYYHHHYSNSIAIVRRRLECVCVVGFIQCLIALSGENRVCGSFAKAKVCVL